VVNIVVLWGRVSRKPEERILPSGDRLAVLDLTVPGEGGPDRPARSASVPLAWFDAPAWALELGAGAELVVAGQVRRRFFRGGAGLQSRTEVLVDAAAPARRPARVAEILRRAARRVDAASGQLEARGVT